MTSSATPPATANASASRPKSAPAEKLDPMVGLQTNVG